MRYESQQSSMHSSSTPQQQEQQQQEQQQQQQQQEKLNAWNQREVVAKNKKMPVMGNGHSELPPPPPPPGPPPTQSPSPQPQPQRQARQQQQRQQQLRRQRQQHQQQQETPSSDNIDGVIDNTRSCFQITDDTSSNIIAFGWIDQQRRSKMCMVWKDVLATLLVQGEEETELLIQRRSVIGKAAAAAAGAVSERLEVLHRIPMRWLVDVDYFGDHRFTLKVRNIAEEFVFRTRDERSARSWISALMSAAWDTGKMVGTEVAGASSDGECTSVHAQMHHLTIHDEHDHGSDPRGHRDHHPQPSTNRPQSHTWSHRQQQQQNAPRSFMSAQIPSKDVNLIDKEPLISAAWQHSSDPYDATSYLPQMEQHSHNDNRPQQFMQHHPGQQHQQKNDKLRRQQPIPPPPPSAPLLPFTLTSSEYSYEWDPQNLHRFLSTRREMLRAIFSTPDTAAAASTLSSGDESKDNVKNNHLNDGNNSANGGIKIDIGIGDIGFGCGVCHSTMNKSNIKNSSTNSKSGGSGTKRGSKHNNINNTPFFFTSPTRPSDSKQFVEDGGGVVARSSINETPPPPPPPPPSLHDADVDAGGGATTTMRQSQHLRSGSTINHLPKQLPLRRSQTEPTNGATVTADAHAFIPPKNGRIGGASSSSSFDIMDGMLPLPKDYFSYAIRYLLMDTPLPLVGSCPPPTPSSVSAPISIPHHSIGNKTAALDNCGNGNFSAINGEGSIKTTIMQPHFPHKIESVGASEIVYLIPRYYLLGWTHWARCTILNASVECWFAAWDKFDVQMSARGDGRRRFDSFSKKKKGSGVGGEGGEGQRVKRVYSLLPEALNALAALSIISDQYQLFINTEQDFIAWMTNLDTCWAIWNERVREYHRHSSQLTHEEEVPKAFPQWTFPVFCPPGPVDSRILSTRRNPLLMHHHVALSMRGILSSYNSGLSTDDDADEGNNDTNSDSDGGVVVLSPADDASESKLMSFIDNALWVPDDEYAIATHSTQKLAVVPVPISFYEMLRSVHGVVCNDGDLSFAPPLPFVNDRGGKVGGMEQQNRMNGTSVKGGDSSLSSCSLLFHDQWEKGIDGPTQMINHQNQGVFGGYHRYYFTNDHHAKSDPLFRPIEFRRQLLPVSSAKEVDGDEGDENSLSFANAAKKGRVHSPYSTLMQEAIKSKKSYDAKEKKNRDGDSSVGFGSFERKDAKDGVAGYVVELFPVKFKYIIVGHDANGDDSCPTSSSEDHAATTTATPEGNQNKSSKNNNAEKSTIHNPKHLHGIALGSRSSSAFAVLRDMQRAATPYRAQACVRLWKKSVCHSATVAGDGYDVLDINTIYAAPSVRSSCRGGGGGGGKDGNLLKGSSPKSIQHLPKQQQPQQLSLTLEQWLGLEPLSIQSINRQKRQYFSNNRSKEEEVVVEFMIEVRSSPASQWKREPLEFENRLQVGDYVDAQDSARKWYEAIVREVKPDTIKVHYFGWGSKWDAELPRKSGSGSKLSPPVPLWTRSANWREQIKVGDEVEIRESTSLVQRPKWHRATVLAVGGENEPPRELEGGAELELLGINAVGKKIPLTLLNRKAQVLVEVPQEMHNVPTSTHVKPRFEGVELVAQPPYRRWVHLYGEEICKTNTHKTADKKRSDLPVTLNYTLESKRDVVEVLKPYNNIHGSGFIRESLRGIPPAAGTVGLHNLGNSCYMNSILQCILHIKPITHFFLKGEYVKEINKSNPLGSGGRLATAYASFLADVYSSEYSILAPRLLKQTLSCFAPQFNNNYQHDSQEFCQYLMDGLHEDLNRVRTKPYVEEMEALGVKDSKAAMESWKKHLLRHDSIFVDYLQGMHRSHLTCPRCGRESIKFDVYSSISLPLVPAKERSFIPLKDCLDQFAAGEQLDEHNAWYCSACKRHVCALKLITLWNTPDVLIIHLKRFTFEKCPIDGRILRRKIEDKVSFPIDCLDLSSYVLGPKDLDAPPVYKLFGVSEHTGSTANSGHYTATVRNSEDGNWYRYNDSHVGTTCEPAVTGGAYLLFYRRVKGSLRWAGMEKQMMNQHNNESNYNSIQAEPVSDGFLEVTGRKRRK